MLPSAITLWNYRCFPGPERLELRPVTLLFGDNNSGKSALLRAVPIFLDTAALPLPINLRSPAARGSSFQDLVWKGARDEEDQDLRLVFEWGNGGSKRYECHLTWFEEWRRIIVRRFSIWDPDGQLSCVATWIPSPDEMQSGELTYALSGQPESVLRKMTAWPVGWVQQEIPTSGQVQWLEANRGVSDRIFAYPSTPETSLNPQGSDSPSVLVSRPEVLGMVSRWYEQNLRRRLRVQEIDVGLFRLMFQHLDRAFLDTDLIENGEGTIQVLPVLTALALARWDLGPRVLAIEEPESHLHPSLQRALAEHICEVAAATPSSRIVLETHSEHMLLGVQLAILEGRLRPEDVLVYWVRQLENGESVADRVTFDEDARQQGGWPPGVFSQDTEMAREIIQKRRERAQV